MAERLRVAIQAPKAVYSGQVFAINVEVTNTGRTPVVIHSVTPQVIPGVLLPLQEKWEITELDELEQRKQTLVQEMEYQLAIAYSELERKEIRQEKSLWRRVAEVLQALVTGMWVVRLMNLVVIEVAPQRGEVPEWAKESARIEEWEDVLRAEKDVISDLPDHSRIRKAFLVDKQKLDSCLQDIATKTASKAADVSLERTVTIDPGDTSVVPFRCRARNSYRREENDVCFQVKWADAKAAKWGAYTRSFSLEVVPSSRIISIGACLGAVAGVLVRYSFVEGPKTIGTGVLQAFGAVALAVLFAAALVRKPDLPKPFAIEDFLGGVLVGGLAGIYSDEILRWLKGILPKASNPPP